MTTGKNETFGFLYIYKYALALPEGVDEITLPDSKGLYLIAATLSDNNHDDVRAASEIHTYPTADELGTSVDFAGGRLIPDYVTANGSVNASEAPAKANDGEVSTKWCSTSANSWLEYRFNDDVVVNRWALLNAGIEGLGMITRDFKVQYYDGGAWKTSATSHRTATTMSPLR